MTISRIVTTTGLAAILIFGLTSAALASTDVTATKTGADSTINVDNTNVNKVTITNENHITVNNDVSNTATSGDLSANRNTSTGLLATGSATSSSTTTTSINVAPVTLPGIGGVGGGNGNGGGTVTGSGGAGGGGGSTSTSPGRGGAGGATAGVTTLPRTGPTNPVNVSALRNLAAPVTAAAPEVLNKTRNFSTILLVIAAILSLLGAAGSAYYAVKGEAKA